MLETSHKRGLGGIAVADAPTAASGLHWRNGARSLVLFRKTKRRIKFSPCYTMGVTCALYLIAYDHDASEKTNQRSFYTCTLHIFVPCLLTGLSPFSPCHPAIIIRQLRANRQTVTQDILSNQNDDARVFVDLADDSGGVDHVPPPVYLGLILGLK